MAATEITKDQFDAPSQEITSAQFDAPGKGRELSGNNTSEKPLGPAPGPDWAKNVMSREVQDMLFGQRLKAPLAGELLDLKGASLQNTFLAPAELLLSMLSGTPQWAAQTAGRVSAHLQGDLSEAGAKAAGDRATYPWMEKISYTPRLKETQNLGKIVQGAFEGAKDVMTDLSAVVGTGLLSAWYNEGQTGVKRRFVETRDQIRPMMSTLLDVGMLLEGARSGAKGVESAYTAAGKRMTGNELWKAVETNRKTEAELLKKSTPDPASPEGLLAQFKENAKRRPIGTDEQGDLPFYTTVEEIAARWAAGGPQKDMFAGGPKDTTVQRPRPAPDWDMGERQISSRDKPETLPGDRGLDFWKTPDQVEAHLAARPEGFFDPAWGQGKTLIDRNSVGDYTHDLQRKQAEQKIAWDNTPPEFRGQLELFTFDPVKGVKDALKLARVSPAFPRDSMAGVLASSQASGMKYTAKVFGDIPKGMVNVPKKFLQDKLAQSKIKLAERELLQGILEQHPGDTIPAEKLINQFRISTGDHTLSPKNTAQYADYGLERIGREVQGNGASGTSPNAPAATTTLWQLPPHVKVSDANHFGDPRLFGWTRSFEEGGVKHVVELQSDLAQKTKMLSSEELAATKEALRKGKEHLGWLKGELARDQGGSTAARDAIRQVTEQEMRVREINAKLAGNEVGERTLATIGPLLKNAPRRLIREELHQAAVQGKEVVRFATADTVAKVEGWALERDYFNPELARNAEERVFLEAEHAKELQKSSTGQKFHDSAHQSIYNRYAGEITRFLKSLGAKEVTDVSGNTWLETPTAPFKGMVELFTFDPARAARDTLRKGGAMAEEAERIFRKHGEDAAKIFMNAYQEGEKAAERARLPVSLQVREAADDLHALRGQRVADTIEGNRKIQEAPPEARTEDAYHNQPSEAGAPMSEEAKKKVASVLEPLNKEKAAAYKEARLESEGHALPEDLEDLAHNTRVVDRSLMQRVGDWFEELGAGALGSTQFGRKAGTMKQRTMLAIEGPNGQRRVVNVDGANLHGYDLEKTPLKDPLFKGKTSADVKVGAELPGGWKVVDATTKEIEAQTNLKYRKDAVMNTVQAIQQLKSYTRESRYLKQLLPLLENQGLAVKKANVMSPPRLFRSVQGHPVLDQYYFNHRFAAVFEDSILHGGPEGGIVRALEKGNSAAVGTLFWNPAPHLFNALDHYINSVNFDLVNPLQWSSLSRSAWEATKDVATVSDDYLAYTRDGWGLQYGNVLAAKGIPEMAKRIPQEDLAGMARAWGMKPVDLVRALYDGSRQLLWGGSDVMMIAARKHLASKAGMDIFNKEIGRIIEAHNPNYRVAAEVGFDALMKIPGMPEAAAGALSRGMSKVMQSRAFNTFGRYHYGQFKSAGSALRDVVMQDKASVMSRGEGLKHAAFIAFNVGVVYPYFWDQIAKGLSGDPSAEQRRAGAATIPYTIWQILFSDESVSKLIGEAFSLPPVTKTIIELVANRNLLTGAHVWEPKDTHKGAIHDAAKFALEETVGPAKQIDAALSGKGKETLLQQAGIKTRSEEAYAKKERAMKRDAAAAKRRQRKRNLFSDDEE